MCKVQNDNRWSPMEEYFQILCQVIKWLHKNFQKLLHWWWLTIILSIVCAIAVLECQAKSMKANKTRKPCAAKIIKTKLLAFFTVSKYIRISGIPNNIRFQLNISLGLYFYSCSMPFYFDPPPPPFKKLEEKSPPFNSARWSNGLCFKRYVQKRIHPYSSWLHIFRSARDG